MSSAAPSPARAGSPSRANHGGDGRCPPRLRHLKTKAECRLGNETIRVWTVELPSRHAEGILKVIKENVVGQEAFDLQHLRRVAKSEDLPAHVRGRRDQSKGICAVSRAWETTPPTLMQGPTAVWRWAVPHQSRKAQRPATLHLLVCPSELISEPALHDLLAKHPPFCSSVDVWAYPLEITVVTVPRLAPTSVEQAASCSEQYWPTLYRKTNPFGPHPTSIAKAEKELAHGADGNVSVNEALELAQQAGAAAEDMAYGIGAGCVVIERVEGQAAVVAIASDARYKQHPSEGGAIIPTATPDGLVETEGTHGNRAASSNKRTEHGSVTDKAGPDRCSSGNVMAHAAMRAVGMVARKRLRCASQPLLSAAPKAESNFAAVDAFFLDLPVTRLEQQYFERDNIKPDGYLCLQLEVFLTHEPCVACAMALVHSRVGRVVFRHRMPQTGGLTAETAQDGSGPVGLGYGLCWRKELNWQFMCWEYTSRPTEEESKNARQQHGYHQDDHAHMGNPSFARIHV